MRILLLSEIFPPKIGGSGRWLWELHRRLRGHEIHVIADVVPGAAEFDATAGVPIHRMPLHFRDWGLFDPRGGLQYIRRFAPLNRLVARIQPDVIHCGRCLPEGLLALLVKARQRVPFTCFAHGEELTLADKSLELRWLTRRVASAARSIVANTHHTKQIVIKTSEAAAEKVAVLHPGVDTDRFTPVPPDPVVRERLGWTGRQVVLTVGALQKRKGQDMLIRALPAIRARCPDVLYAIVGEGWEREYLDSLVAEHDVADFVQFRPTPGDEELIACYQQCDLFALPNRQVGWDFEGFGIVLLEAQACGKPVVAGRSGGTSETMKPSCTGELVPCETPEPLADAVVRLLDAPDVRSRMGACAREWAVERFDWPMLVAQASGMFGGRA